MMSLFGDSGQMLSPGEHALQVFHSVDIFLDGEVEHFSLASSSPLFVIMSMCMLHRIAINKVLAAVASLKRCSSDIFEAPLLFGGVSQAFRTERFKARRDFDERKPCRNRCFQIVRTGKLRDLVT